MPHEHALAIEQVVTDVLQQMAFVFVDPAGPDELPDAPKGLVRVQMRFRGHTEGSLTITSGPEICDELAANIAGDQATGDQSIGKQALMELANVICGQLLTAVAGDEPVFDLEPPRLVDVDPLQWEKVREDQQSVAFVAEDCPLVIQWCYSQVA